MAVDTSDYVLYLEDRKVLICLNEGCKHALTPNGIALHFRTFHKDAYDLRVRRQIMDYANSLTLSHPSEVRVPMDVTTPIEGLRIHNGWQCTQCSDVGPVFEAARGHCTREHNWSSTRGNDAKAKF